MDGSAYEWIKSSSSVEDNCVEVRTLAEEQTVHVRDSKDPDSAVLCFSLDEWHAFVEGVHRGEFTFKNL